jgi:hypothetical protein
MDVNSGLRGAIVYNTNETTGTGIYVWNGKYWRPAAEPDSEQILFTVHTTNGDYSIPTSGRVSSTFNHAYDWDITVDGLPVCPDGHCTGTGEYNSPGIVLKDLGIGDHRIRITPHGGADPGWGNAFGYCDSIYGANIVTNKQKLISIDAPLTTMAFAPKISENATNASSMFAGLFTGCSNLTTTAVIRDTYKLPETITILAGFLSHIHNGNSALTVPLDLAPLSGWISENQKITNLSYYLLNIHSGNSSLAAPIDLTPLSGWFNGNTSITDLTAFLYGIHSGNSALVNPINLDPLSGWFNGNQKIIYLSSFLQDIHSGNSNLASPIVLEPLKDWFKDNTSITNLVNFLSNAHSDNSSLPNTINLMPLKDWFNNNTYIESLRGLFIRTHAGNSVLVNPINLDPLSGWFNGNQKINDLSNFLYQTHLSNEVLTAPVNLTPLSGWFSADKAMNLTNFLAYTHYNNYNFTLSSQPIFPNWIQTMKLTDGTPIWNVTGAFFRTFALAGTQNGNSEPTFQNGTTLSSMGEPSIQNNMTTIDEYITNKETYKNRNGFIPDNNNWK